MTYIRPRGNNVFVRRMPSPTSSGGVVFPKAQADINSSDVLKFQVIAVGPGRRTRKGVLIAPEVAPRDIVLWQSYSAAPVEVANGYYSIKASDIIGILSKEDAAPQTA